MAEAELLRAAWCKSSHSGTGDNCVEAARLHGGHVVRDSKDPDSGVLTFDTIAWNSFITRIKQGEWDL